MTLPKSGESLAISASQHHSCLSLFWLPWWTWQCRHALITTFSNGCHGKVPELCQIWLRMTGQLVTHAKGQKVYNVYVYESPKSQLRFEQWPQHCRNRQRHGRNCSSQLHDIVRHHRNHWHNCTTVTMSWNHWWCHRNRWRHRQNWDTHAHVTMENMVLCDKKLAKILNSLNFVKCPRQYQSGCEGVMCHVAPCVHDGRLLEEVWQRTDKWRSQVRFTAKEPHVSSNFLHHSIIPHLFGKGLMKDQQHQQTCQIFAPKSTLISIGAIQSRHQWTEWLIPFLTFLTIEKTLKI